MSLDWYTLEHGLSTLFASLMGLETSLAAEPDAAYFPNMSDEKQASATIQIFSFPQTGQAERRWVDAPGGWVESPWGETWVDSPGLQEQSVLQGELTVRVKVEALNQRWPARLFLVRLRDRLAWLSTAAALKSLGAGFQRVASLVDLGPLIIDGRERSAGALDVILNLETQDTDPTIYEVIESANVEPGPAVES